MQLDTITVTPDTLIGEVAKLKNDGWRMVTMTCVDVSEEEFQLLYHFDKELAERHLRMNLPKGQAAPSITPTLFMAVLVENEIKDHYGVCFDGLPLDFDGRLYLEDEVKATPFCKYGTVRKQ
ncbi:NADH dehydrogenase (ubiquinone) 30 kDa subunit [Desulfovibrio sp. X2]|uniref:NADH-quinone oxidoreductase subunit C n=1 Tax=Desulfovibrio sp. X2 TaxID=941449 RepID=UPI000358890D|nr:NADH-quinone oxidoreductase subunit C [Desulfovibrio sp. X2]EPR44068.1 NADH dehydrogenase (ubiquinone) 30 kDa subunit [Desulfovibrio sp. X2]